MVAGLFLDNCFPNFRLNFFCFVVAIFDLVHDMVQTQSRIETSDTRNMRIVMRKPDFCICENKDADQLRGNREADQRLCFRYMDSTIPLLSKSEISSL